MKISSYNAIIRAKMHRHTKEQVNINLCIFQTSKHRQSYRHADPRRQQQHASLATVTVFVIVWPWPLTSGSMHAERLL